VAETADLSGRKSVIMPTTPTGAGLVLDHPGAAGHDAGRLHPAGTGGRGTSPVAFPGDADPGGRDPVAASAAEAVANTEARYHELAADTYGAGSTIGDVMDLPSVVSDWSKHTGSASAADFGPAG
jgi:hypothetical protein